MGVARRGTGFRHSAPYRPRSLGRAAPSASFAPLVWGEIVRMSVWYPAGIGGRSCALIGYTYSLFDLSISNGLGRRYVPNLVRSGRKQP